MNVWAKGSVAVSAVAVLVLVMAIATAPADQAGATSGCNGVSLRGGSRLMDAYSRAGEFPAVQTTAADGVPADVSVEIPPIRFTGPGHSATLPVGPCQNIYRFQFENIRAPGGAVPSRG